MLVRRPLAALAALAVLSLLGGTAACSTSSNTNATAAGTPTPPAAAASPSPSATARGNTTTVCDAAGKVVTEATAKELGTQIGYMIAAKKNHNAAAEAAAEKKVKAQLDAWVKGLRRLAPTASDPALSAALTQAADGLAALETDAYLAKITTVSDTTKIENDMATAASGLSKTCP